jgi:hypothetical protein
MHTGKYRQTDGIPNVTCSSSKGLIMRKSFKIPKCILSPSHGCVTTTAEVEEVNTTWRKLVLLCFYSLRLIRDSIVGIETGYRLDDQRVGVRVPVGSRIFSSPRRPDRFWSPPNLLSNGYGGLFPRG